MKNFSSFGFSVVNAGQRNVAVEPQLIATSTNGGFRITGPASRVLGITPGDYLMFINNVPNVDVAINEHHETIVAFCDERGLDITSPEAALAIHAEFDMWAVAKGIQEFDSKGLAKKSTERLTAKDKVAFATQNFDEMLAAAMESGNEELVAALTREGVTKEEQIDALAGFVIPREVNKYKGSKLANPTGQTGSGLTLSCTDSNVWAQLKADLKDDAEKVNRVYELDVENVQVIPVDNGYETLEVRALVLGVSTDKEPARIGKGAAEDAE